MSEGIRENAHIQTARPAVTPADRFGLTLCLAIIIHAIIVLGITFSREDILPANYDTMEVILVQQKSRAPKEAKRLAQANLEGGGDTEEPVNPVTPLPPPFPDELAAITMPETAPPPTATGNPQPDREILAVDSDQGEMTVADPETEKRAEQADNMTEDRPLPDAATLLAKARRMAALSAEIQNRLETRAERPRRQYVTASTREFKYATYMEAWRLKVERVGNLNYPEAARQQNLSGSLILEVALKPDGAVHDIIIRKSSGYKILDDAAIRIVRLAAPFAPFPDNIREETDILHITRTWQFLDNKGFR